MPKDSLPSGKLPSAVDAPTQWQFQALLEEYKILKSETADNGEASSRAIGYIQIFGIFLIIMHLVYFGKVKISGAEITAPDIPVKFWVLAIISASLFLFILYSHVSHASFKFRVLRARMKEIEEKINEICRSDVFRYESMIVGNVFAKPLIAGKVVSPVWWINLFVNLLFFCAVAMIVMLTASILRAENPVFSLICQGTILYIAASIVIENVRLLGVSGKELISELDPTLSRHGILQTTYIVNYFIFIAIVFLFGIEYIADVGDNWIVSWINMVFEKIYELSHIQVMILVSLYTTLCGIFLPVPAELTIKLVDKFGIVGIFFFSATGKALGAYILFKISKFYMRKGDIRLDAWEGRINSAILRKFLNMKSIDVTYFVLQSIPFAPMRSATLGYAALAKDGRRAVWVVIFGSAIGTVSRMLFFVGVDGLAERALAGWGTFA